MRYLIYGLVDPITRNLRYIGKSSSGLRRAKNHQLPCYLSKDRTHKGNWIRQLLAANLAPEVVIVQALEDGEILNEAEIHWIAYFRLMGCPLTNITRGGDGQDPEFARVHAIKTGLGNWWKGKKQSIEHIRRRTRNSPPPSEATKAKISKALLGRPAPKGPDHGKKVSLGRGVNGIVDSNGTTYPTIRAAARELHIPHPNIVAVLKGRAKTARGITFQYVPR